MWLIEMMGDIPELFRDALIEPTCGWAWLEENRLKRYPAQYIEVLRDGQVLFVGDGPHLKQAMQMSMSLQR